MANKSYIYAEFQEYLDRNKLDNAYIAEQVLYCTPVTFSKKMNGKSPFNNRDIGLLCKVFGFSGEEAYRLFIFPCEMIYKEVRDMDKFDYTLSMSAAKAPSWKERLIRN